MHLTKLKIALNATIQAGNDYYIKLIGMIFSIIVSVMSYLIRDIIDFLLRKNKIK